MLVLAGLARVGWLAEFLSAPIVTGFVAGLVVLIVGLAGEQARSRQPFRQADARDR